MRKIRIDSFDAVIICGKYAYSCYFTALLGLLLCGIGNIWLGLWIIFGSLVTFCVCCLLAIWLGL